MGCSVSIVVTGRSSGIWSLCVAEHRFGLSVRACDEFADGRAGHEAAPGPVDARQRGHDGKAGVLALGQVNSLRERLIGVRGAIDGDEDVGNMTPP